MVLLQMTIQFTTLSCMICAKNNPSPDEDPARGTCFPEDWQMGFTQMPQGTGNVRYMLVFVNSFSGMNGAISFPYRKSLQSGRSLPRFGLPNTFPSDNWPAFILSMT